jgi:DNA-directed RNA polymerase specialized sigma24 family protein
MLRGTATLPPPRAEVEEPLPKRGRPQRRELPASPEVTRAQQLARKRARLESQLQALTVTRWRTVLELRAGGVSQLDCADLLDVTKPRVQQLVREAEAHYGVTVDQVREHLQAGGLLDDLLP